MRTRITDRLPGAMLALLLQGAFLFLLMQSVQVFHRKPLAPRELTWILPRLAPKPVPHAPARSGGVTAAPGSMPMREAAPPAATAPDAGALRGFGKSLFGCAPEAYAMLPPEDRAHCPRPGENGPPTAEDELFPRSHSKDAATWQEDLDERHFDYSGCMGAQLVVTCMTQMMGKERARAGQRRREIDAEKEKAATPPLSDITVRRAPARSGGVTVQPRAVPLPEAAPPVPAR